MLKKILGAAASIALLNIIACSDDNSSGMTIVPEGDDSSSSVAETLSSSDGGSAAESSSQDATVSSSSETPSENAEACLWNAKKGEYIVKTGFDPDGTHGAGYWYSYSDNEDGGVSNVVWDAECPNDGTDCMQHLVDMCGGICGKMYLDKGNASEAVVGVAFNVAGLEDPTAEVSHPLSADISDWGGICVTYSSDLNLYVRLGVGEDAEVIAELGKSENLVEKCLTWADFDKDAEGENPMPAAEAAKKIKNIKFGKVSGETMTGNFTIVSVGKYVASGACNAGLVNTNSGSSSVSSPEQSSSSVSEECADPKSVREMWNGSEAPISYVETGADNGTETSGYWFSFGDGESGNGKVNYPSTLGIDYTTGNELFDYCKGVCGELEFAKDGYLGIGFHVAGVVDPEDGNSLISVANISDWGGLCVTYASESDLDVVVSNIEDGNYASVSQLSKVTLPKSVEVKTQCVKWDRFESVEGKNGAPGLVASILFVSQGDASSQSRFNIKGLGKYSKTSNFCAQGEDEFVSGKKDLVIK